ncbi:ArsR/SmtB family transcription factor [Balneatrix alpica]|uniref:ArsR/SmtB family transcription factor n=1 Tax=Balneatrix alpica TaxID=75684 RepID=A0ABV5ZB95_9GAMM|nr:metalloregulator ArsR/SmtB family transcription factor [Balneatrix alpica]
MLSSSSLAGPEAAARLLKALANPERLRILCELSQGERKVQQLENCLGIAQPNLSQQLRVLREQQLVSTRRQGTCIHYRIRQGPALAVLQTLHQHFCVTTATT